MKGGYVDCDVYSDPRYLAIQKVELRKGLTAVKVLYNTTLQHKVWKQILDINLYMAGVLSNVYQTEVVFGRVTSLSIQNETVVTLSNGKNRGNVSGKGVLNDELKAIGFPKGVNEVLNTVDVQVAALHSVRELRAIQATMKEMVTNLGAEPAYLRLVSNLDKSVIPQVVEKNTMPTFLDLHKFAREFIRKEATTKIGQIKATGENAEDVYAAKLAAVMSKYIMYSTLLGIDARAEMYFYVLDDIEYRD